MTSFDSQACVVLESELQVQDEVSEKGKNIRTRTREIMRDVDFNAKAAVEELVRRAEDDYELRCVLMRFGAEQAVRHYFTEERRLSRVQPTTDFKVLDDMEMQSRREEKIRRRLFWDRYALFGHMELRSAKKKDLGDSANKRRQQAAGNLRCADFEEDIMKRLKGDEIRVEQQFTIDKVIEIAKAHHVVS